MSSFSKDAIERVIRTTVQVAAGSALLYLTGAIGDGGWDSIVWSNCLKLAGGAALLSLLTAIAGKQFASPNDASFTNNT